MNKVSNRIIFNNFIINRKSISINNPRNNNHTSIFICYCSVMVNFINFCVIQSFNEWIKICFFCCFYLFAYHINLSSAFLIVATLYHKIDGLSIVILKKNKKNKREYFIPLFTFYAAIPTLALTILIKLAIILGSNVTAINLFSSAVFVSL